MCYNRFVVWEGVSFPHAGVAQSVEQLIRNQQVVGSSPISSSSGLEPQQNRALTLVGARFVFVPRWYRQLAGRIPVNKVFAGFFLFSHG